MKSETSLTIEKIYQIAIVIIVVNFSNIDSVQHSEENDYIDCNLDSNVISIYVK